MLISKRVDRLDGGNSNIVYFHPYILGEMIQFDEHIFHMGWFKHQLVSEKKTPELNRDYFINTVKFSDPVIEQPVGGIPHPRCQ